MKEKRTESDRASGERVSLVSGATAADWVVIPHSAVGVDAARALARVYTVLIHTGQGLGAIGGHQALWPAVGRGAEVVVITRAHSLSVVPLALRIRAAWARKTGVHLDGWLWRCS